MTYLNSKRFELLRVRNIGRYSARRVQKDCLIAVDVGEGGAFDGGEDGSKLYRPFVSQNFVVFAQQDSQRRR